MSKELIAVQWKYRINGDLFVVEYNHLSKVFVLYCNAVKVYHCDGGGVDVAEDMPKKMIEFYNKKKKE